MRGAYTKKLKQWVRPAVYRLTKRKRESFTCPVCDYTGPFKDKRVRTNPTLVRRSSKCPSCSATERHRMLYLTLNDLLSGQWDPTGRSLLHIAPESCLTPLLSAKFQEYHTADLFRPDVDFKEDLQRLSFADKSYDCVLISRVLISPPDLEACLHETSRILKPGGVAILAEYYPRAHTDDFGELRGDRFRELGCDAIDLYRRHFESVDLVTSKQFDPSYQLINRTELDGHLHDDYPALVQAPGLGLLEVVALCRKEAA